MQLQKSVPYNLPLLFTPYEACQRGMLVIGENVQIAPTARFQFTKHTKRIYIGPGSSIGHNALIYENVTFQGKVTINPNTVIESGCVISDGTFIGTGCMLRPDTLISKNCKIGHMTVFEGKTTIKRDTLIHAQCHITRGVLIGQGCFIAPFFIGANDSIMLHMRRHIHPYADNPYTIGDFVRIAVGVIMLPGVNIGNNAVIGAGAVVTKDVPENAIVKGLPARVVGKVDKKWQL